MAWNMLNCFFMLNMATLAYGVCDIPSRVSGCEYTVHCVGNPTSIYTSGCDEDPNVTFVMESSNVRLLSLGFFSRTNFDQRVRHFKALNNIFNIIEQNAFKYYKKCLTIDLSYSNIRSIENQAFNELTMLKALNLSNNRLDHLRENSLQLSSVLPNSLETLDLSNNVLNAIEGNVFGNLMSLQTLFLHNNNIQTMANYCFSTLKQLRYLTLYNNKLTSLNTTLVAIGELRYLDISRNHITKLSGIDMVRLVSLTELNMSQNAIESIEYNCFNQAFSLQTLDLSHNKISTTIDMQMFSNNRNLTYLNLYNNSITTLGDFVFKSTKLNYFNIENNQMNGNITNNTFIGLQNITCLNITHQHIKYLRDNAFSEMIHLKHLDLSYNDIEVIENLSFENASALIILNLSHNEIKDLDFFQMFASNVTDIYMNNNVISMLPKYIFSNHTSLTTLDLSSNVITTIEPNALPLQTLQFLNIKDNKLSGTLVDGIFSPARYLKYLDLSHHDLKAINESALTNLPLLESLDLSDNDIQYIDPHNFANEDSMNILNISYNNLTNLYLEGTFGNLTMFLINNNRLTCIPNIVEFANASNIYELDFSHNNISNVTYSGFQNLTNLAKLNLSYNKISYFNNNFTNTITSLFELVLEANHLKEINLTYFVNLRNVNISDNDITNLDESQFRNLDNLMLLDVRANKIKEILPGTFQHLSSLRFLVLSENFMTNLRFGCFRGLNTTSVIDLSRNSIKSINVDIFHECYQLTMIIIDYNNISSVDVERLVEVAPNLQLVSLGGNPIACHEIVRNHKKLKAKNVNITSMHKIYHEDNVHGIKCGENNDNITFEVTTEVTTLVTEKSQVDGGGSSVVLVTWCSVLSILLVLGLGFVYWRHRRFTVNSDTRLHFQNTTSSRNSECYSDLLS